MVRPFIILRDKFQKRKKYGMMLIHLSEKIYFYQSCIQIFIENLSRHSLVISTTFQHLWLVKRVLFLKCNNPKSSDLTFLDLTGIHRRGEIVTSYVNFYQTSFENMLIKHTLTKFELSKDHEY